MTLLRPVFQSPASLQILAIPSHSQDVIPRVPCLALEVSVVLRGVLCFSCRHHQDDAALRDGVLDFDDAFCNYDSQTEPI